MQYDNRTAGERLWYDESFYDIADFEVDEEFDEEADLLRWFDRGEKLYDYLDGRIWKQNEAKRAARSEERRVGKECRL